MKALVSGAGGLVGSRVAQMLAGRGTPVTVFTRAETDLRHLRGLQLRVVRGSLNDFAAVREAVRGCTHIFHCAARQRDRCSERAYFETNVLGTGMLLEAASRERRLERFVHLSTTDVYGYPRQPCAEDADLLDTGLPYQRSRVQAELAVWGFADEGVPVTVLRPATIFGPRSRESVVEIVQHLRQHRLCLVDGGQVRGGFCYVDNVASAMLSVCTEAQTQGQAYNLTDSTGVTWREYIRILAQSLGLSQPRLDLPFPAAIAAARVAEVAHAALTLPGQPLLTRRAVYTAGRDREFSSKKATQDFGYVPEISFPEAMRRSAEWIVSNEQQTGVEPGPSGHRVSGFPS